ncbi:hypothetical protein GOV06_02800 [Candidatus Woesearchaeota archaeon]|nr:hypothetical protein [Candidatus Woesearchaeota archaeon]
MGLESIVKGIAAAVLAAGMFITSAASEESIEVKVNYKTETKPKKTSYVTGDSTYIRGMSQLDLVPNILFLTNPEEIQVEDVMNDIRDNNINSYQELVQRAGTLSDSQNIALFAAIAGFAEEFNYETSEDELVSQNSFFSALQYSLNTGNERPIGDCVHIHSFIEKLADDLGMESAAISGNRKGKGHLYSLVKLDNGLAVIDYEHILLTNTNNVKKTLEAYQKNIGTASFEHMFLEDGKMKYKLITDDGKHLFDFLDYDPCFKPLKDLLLHGVKEEKGTIITLDKGDYVDSAKLNHNGFFAKIGTVRGSESSPLKHLDLIHFGYAMKSSESDMDSDMTAGLIYGKIHHDLEIDNNDVYGLTISSSMSTNNEQGFSIGGKVAATLIRTADDMLNKEWMIGAVGSYNAKTEAADIKPYVVVQFADFYEVGAEHVKPGLYEAGVGALVKFNKANLSVESYFMHRPWEKEFGADVKIGSKDIGIDLGIYKTVSDYEFCPDKQGITAGLYINSGKKGFTVNYQREEEDYGGDPEETESINAGFFIKF